MATSLHQIAVALGGSVSAGQVSCPGPGHSRGDRSMTVRLSPTAPDGFIVHSHAGDDFGVCRDHVRSRLGMTRDDRREVYAPPAEPTANGATTTPQALALWDASVDPRGSLAETYLNSRALELGADIAGEVLRFHAGINAMIALFRNIATDEPQAVSRTFLDRYGRKRDRQFLGPVGRAAIKLDADDAVTGGLHIGEGIETCLSARQLGLKPTWALGSKGEIAKLPALSGIECLTILAEPDAAKEVQECRERWNASGREVRIVRPKIGKGKDLNDAILGAA
jgi:putative DNA primase/helicase